jgi:hypothetical protein
MGSAIISKYQPLWLCIIYRRKTFDQKLHNVMYAATDEKQKHHDLLRSGQQDLIAKH